MKTKTTKLLVLLMAVVMQGFVSVSWGQSEDIIDKLDERFNYDESNKKYNSVSRDLAISDADDWNDFAEICNSYSNSDIQGAIDTVRIVGEITFGPNGNITINTIPSGVTLSSEVSIGSGIHTIKNTTQPLINVLEGKLMFVALDSSTITANDGETGVYYYDTERGYKCFSPFVLCNKGKIYGCEVRNSTITIESLTNNGNIHIGAIASYSPGSISNCIVKNNNLFDIANGKIDGVKEISIGHVVGLGCDNNYNHGRVDSCYCQITTEDHLFGSDMKNNCEFSNISISSNGVTGLGGTYDDNVIAFIPGSYDESFENAKSQTTYDDIRYLSPQAGSANNWTHYKSRSELQVQINKFLNNAAKYLVRSKTPETVYINGTEVSVYPPMICPQQASMKKEYESYVIKSINSASEWNQMAMDYQYSSLDPAIEKIQISDELDFTGTIVRGIELPEGIILDGGGYKIYGVAEEYEEGEKTKTYSSPLVKINAGVIQNVFIDGLFICSDNATTLNYSLLCGENNDTIQHCGVQNSKITVPNSDGTAHFGFLVADNNGIVDHCYAACNGYALPDNLDSSSVALSQLVAESEYGTINESFAVDYDYNSISSNKLERYPLCGTSFNTGLPSVLSNNAEFLIDKGEALKETESHVFLSPNDNIYCQYTCSSDGVNDDNANSVKVYTSVA